MEFAENGLYLCSYGADEMAYYGKKAHIAGDQLSELPKKES